VNRRFGAVVRRYIVPSAADIQGVQDTVEQHHVRTIIVRDRVFYSALIATVMTAFDAALFPMIYARYGAEGNIYEPTRTNPGACGASHSDIGCYNRRQDLIYHGMSFFRVHRGECDMGAELPGPEADRGS